MKRRSHWPSCITDSEYSNRCYADNAADFKDVYLCMPHLGMHVLSSRVKSNDCRLTLW